MPTIDEVKNDERYMRLLAEKFPTISAVTTEIINLEAILSLPKGTEHFVSDLHGSDGAFIHIVKNASGVIRRKVDDTFGDRLSEEEKRALCALIYYPDERLAYYHAEGFDMEPLYRTRLQQIVEVTRAVTVKYTRSKVRKMLPKEFAYVIEELLHESTAEKDRQDYYNAIIDAIIATGRAEALIIAICYVIHNFAIDTLHIVGDIFDRGPGACKIMEVLSTYHDFDIQWGNHDIEWMGAAAGNLALMATVLRVSIRYANVETLEEDYSINLLPLANFAMNTYGNDPCTVFQTKDFENNPRLTRSAQLMAKMHKAISIIQFKLEGQIIKRNPEYQMDDRLLLHLIDKKRGVITIDGKEYELLDKNLPTLDPDDPYALSAEEQQLVDQLARSFRRSEKMQKHLHCLYQHGSLFLVHNNCLLYHAAIPLNADGSFQEVTLHGERLKGRALMEQIDQEIRKAYYLPTDSCSQQKALDYMWYLWCGPCSPLYNKDKMTTFERYFIDDETLYKETKGAYYELANQRETCCNILREFGLDPETAHIINGHIPVRTLKGESPLRAGGMRLVIDGGFSKPYQAQTGIAGYTLIYNSHGMQLIEHEKFESREQAVLSGSDIHSRMQLVDMSSRRMLVRDTDRGKELVEQVNNLKRLLYAYQHGILKEKLEQPNASAVAW